MPTRPSQLFRALYPNSIDGEGWAAGLPRGENYKTVLKNNQAKFWPSVDRSEGAVVATPRSRAHAATTRTAKIRRTGTAWAAAQKQPREAIAVSFR